MVAHVQQAAIWLIPVTKMISVRITIHLQNRRRK